MDIIKIKMETSDFDFENLTSIFDKVVLENISDEKYKEILVAYSGGIDSTALLYFANKFSKKHNKNIKAIHVNHNINIKSKNWEKHCQVFCNSLNIPLSIPITITDSGVVAAADVDATVNDNNFTGLVTISSNATSLSGTRAIVTSVLDDDASTPPKVDGSAALNITLTDTSITADQYVALVAKTTGKITTTITETTDGKYPLQLGFLRTTMHLASCIRSERHHTSFNSG